MVDTDEVKGALSNAAEHVRAGFEKAKDRLHDKVEEVNADAEVKKAEAERDAVKGKNEVKEALR